MICNSLCKIVHKPAPNVHSSNRSLLGEDCVSQAAVRTWAGVKPSSFLPHEKVCSFCISTTRPLPAGSTLQTPQILEGGCAPQDHGAQRGDVAPPRTMEPGVLPAQAHRVESASEDTDPSAFLVSHGSSQDTPDNMSPDARCFPDPRTSGTSTHPTRPSHSTQSPLLLESSSTFLESQALPPPRLGNPEKRQAFFLWHSLWRHE